MVAIPDFSIYTKAEIEPIRDAIKAERLRRLSGEQLQSGNRQGISFAVSLMSEDALSAMESAIAARLGTRSRNNRVRMNFNTRIR